LVQGEGPAAGSGAICNLEKGEVMEVVEGQGRQKVEEYLDSLPDSERVKGVAMEC